MYCWNAKLSLQLVYLYSSVFKLLVVRCWYLGFGVLSLLDWREVGLVWELYLVLLSLGVLISFLQSLHCFHFQLIMIFMLYIFMGIIVAMLYIPIVFIWNIVLIWFIHYRSRFILIHIIILWIFEEWWRLLFYTWNWSCFHICSMQKSSLYDFVVHFKHGTATGNECSMMVCMWPMKSSYLILKWTEETSYNWIDWLKMMKSLATVAEREARCRQCCTSWCCLGMPSSSSWDIWRNTSTLILRCYFSKLNRSLSTFNCSHLVSALSFSILIVSYCSKIPILLSSCSVSALNLHSSILSCIIL